MRSTIGSWAFLLGVIIAVIIGFLQTSGFTSGVAWLLVLIGLIVGILNIADKEVQSYLMAGTVLVIVASLGSGVFAQVKPLDSVLNAFLFLFEPSKVVVALRHVFSIARS